MSLKQCSANPSTAWAPSRFSQGAAQFSKENFLADLRVSCLRIILPVAIRAQDTRIIKIIIILVSICAKLPSFVCFDFVFQIYRGQGQVNGFFSAGVSGERKERDRQ